MSKRHRGDEAATPRPKHVRNSNEIGERLGELLSLEYFLIKVLAHLRADGLHECRLVCRLWRDVVKQLPVAICLYNDKWLPSARKAFPSASAISCSRDTVSADISLKSSVRQGPMAHGSPLGGELLSFIEGFSNLTRLAISHSTVEGDVGQIEAAFAALSRLKRLDLAVTDSKYCFKDCVLSLRHLTNLTSLSIGLANSDTTAAEPLTGLTKIERLALHPDFLATRNEALFFPNLKSLRELTIRTLHSRHHTRYPSGLLCVLSRYGATLRRLEIRPPYADEFSHAELQALRRFRHLKTFVSSGRDVRLGPFWREMSRIQSLTEVDVMPLDLGSDVVKSSVFSLRKLRTLAFGDMTRETRPEDLPPFTQLSHLTRLNVTGVVLADLTPMTGIVDLAICDRTASDGFDASVPVGSLPQLRRLRLSGSTVKIASSVLGGLTQMTWLALENVNVDEGIFEALATLRGLLSLHVHFPTEQTHLYAQVNLVTSLTSLTLWNSYQDDVQSYDYLIEGRLTRLKYLRLEKNLLGNEEAMELRRRLPRLRKIMSREL